MKQTAKNTLHVKQSNMELMRCTLRDIRSGTRNNIAAITGLSLATCGNLLNDMLEKGEVFEAELEESNGGRPARKYTYNENFALIASICITAEGKEKVLCYEVNNLYGEYIKREVNKYEILDIDVIDKLIGDILSEFKNIRALGIGIPGVVTKNGTIKTCDIKELTSKNIKQFIKEKYKIEVVVENETHAVAYGAYKSYGGGEKINSLTTLIAPDGYCLGAGIITCGQILRGYKNLAGEVSLLPKEISHNWVNVQPTNNETFIKSIVNAIISITAIINPEVVILMGSGIQESMLTHITMSAKRYISEEYLPQILYQPNWIKDYQEGIKAITLSKLIN